MPAIFSPFFFFQLWRINLFWKETIELSLSENSGKNQIIISDSPFMP
jgi:hypothetical protein